jgi:AraC-like DNA-binding protein
MHKEIRNVCFDTELNIEAYSFRGIAQKFPNHFHDHYVIGFIEDGQRYLTCKNKSYRVEPGDILLFNPHDNHCCEQIGCGTLDYRCINIDTNVIRRITFEITNEDNIPFFTENVLFGSSLIPSLCELHRMIMQEKRGLNKEEIFFLIMEQLIMKYSDLIPSKVSPDFSAKIDIICRFLKENYMKSVSLNDLSNLTGISKYHLLHSFTKKVGISPYNYLQAIRISEAKKFLEEGIPPLGVALKTGFTDQSHFSNFFKKIIGLTPKQYQNIFLYRNEEKYDKKIAEGAV